MTIPLLVATTNKKKLREIQELFADFPIRILPLEDLPSYREVPEPGKTFKDHAVLKAIGYARQSGILTMAEDSGLSCDALEGAPGVYSARFAGEPGHDDANNAKLLKLLEKIPDNCRGAHYTSAIALALPDELIGVVEGEVHGFIGRELRGTNGFGYDPLFFYPSYAKTFGEVSAEMKHRISHRARAFEKAKGLFQSFLTEKSKRKGGSTFGSRSF